jgi:hypothetical protein
MTTTSVFKFFIVHIPGRRVNGVESTIAHYTNSAFKRKPSDSIPLIVSGSGWAGQIASIPYPFEKNQA